MILPLSLRDNLITDTQNFIEAMGDHTDAESIAGFVIEQLEMYGEEAVLDDIIAGLEDQSDIDGALSEFLEDEISSNQELFLTGEEIITLIERVTLIEWVKDEDLDETCEEPFTEEV